MDMAPGVSVPRARTLHGFASGARFHVNIGRSSTPLDCIAGGSHHSQSMIHTRSNASI